MKKIYRLVKNDDFVSVIKTGKTLKNESYVVHYKFNDVDHIRIGVSTSTKLGHAVVRNRIRRQVRAMCDKQMSVDSKFDILIIVKSHFLSNSFEKNNELLCNLLKEMKGKKDEKEN